MFLLKRNSLLLSGLLIFCLMATACTTVPITGRKQLAVIPAAQIQNLSRSQYDQFLKEHPLSKDAAKTRLVKRVGRQIQQAVEKYFADNNMSERLSGFEWEFNLVAADEVNAWAMPGGKVVVYEGILPLTEDAVGLAVVMGHEIAHVVARHGRERMSQKLLVQLGGMALETALKQNPSLTTNLFMQAYGLGAQTGVILPYSRVHENEADRLGMIFMAMAGYHPRRAIRFWEKMAAKQEERQPPEFLSTHPSDATRIQNMKANLPEALKYYDAN